MPDSAQHGSCDNHKAQDVLGFRIFSIFCSSETVLPLVCCVGIVGNLTAVLVLLSPLMRYHVSYCPLREYRISNVSSICRTTTFHQSLLFLVGCDILFLIMTFTDEFIDQSSQAYILIFPYFW